MKFFCCWAYYTLLAIAIVTPRRNANDKQIFIGQIHYSRKNKPLKFWKFGGIDREKSVPRVASRGGINSTYNSLTEMDVKYGYNNPCSFNTTNRPYTSTVVTSEWWHISHSATIDQMLSIDERSGERAGQDNSRTCRAVGIPKSRNCTGTTAHATSTLCHNS